MGEACMNWGGPILLKPHVPVYKVRFSLENCFLSAKCPFITISSLHFGARIFKDILRGFPARYLTQLYDLFTSWSFSNRK